MSALLDLPPRDAALFAEFRKLQVAHRLQSDALDEVWRVVAQARHSRAAKPDGEGEITLLYGPTGVGKTALWDACRERAEACHQQRALNGRLAYLYTLCAVSGSGLWLMKEFYSATLAAADEILVQHKQLVKPVASAQSSWQATQAGLHLATLNMIKYRQPLVFAIDEAHHLGIHSSDQQKEKNLDAIKTFADQAVAPILMIGSYELIDFESRSGRLGRRVRAVHLPRYNIEKADDQFEYKSVVHFFSQRLPKGSTNLDDRFLFFMEQTVGCVGLFKQWLDRAYFRALWAGRRTVSDLDIDEVAPLPALVDQWLDEINAGETRLREQAHGSTGRAPTTRRRGHRTKKPFQRNQITDPVGTARRAPRPS